MWGGSEYVNVHMGGGGEGAYPMFGQFNDLPRSEARDRASEVSKDTEGGAAASICASEAAAAALHNDGGGYPNRGG